MQARRQVVAEWQTRQLDQRIAQGGEAVVRRILRFVAGAIDVAAVKLREPMLRRQVGSDGKIVAGDRVVLFRSVELTAVVAGEEKHRRQRAGQQRRRWPIAAGAETTPVAGARCAPQPSRGPDQPHVGSPRPRRRDGALANSVFAKPVGGCDQRKTLRPGIRSTSTRVRKRYSDGAETDFARHGNSTRHNSRAPGWCWPVRMAAMS